MQVDETLEELLHHALDLAQREHNFLVSHTRQVIVQVVEQQKVAATHLVFFTR